MHFDYKCQFQRRMNPHKFGFYCQRDEYFTVSILNAYESNVNVNTRYYQTVIHENEFHILKDIKNLSL